MIDPSTFADAFLRAMRVLACVTGLLVVIDSVGVLMRVPEFPRHRPRANALAWLIAGATAALVSGFLLAGRYGWIGAQSSLTAKLVGTSTWVGFSIAFILRATTRAPRPWLTITAALLMSVFGTVLALADPLG
jgi:hypothetical protein